MDERNILDKSIPMNCAPFIFQQQERIRLSKKKNFKYFETCRTTFDFPFVF